MSPEDETAVYYSIYVFDCPVCGGRTEIGDRDVDRTETCEDCGAEITMAI